jgi:hypothetical protein
VSEYVVICDDGLRSGCERRARWWITNAAGENPMCDLHAEGYLRHPADVYPRRPVNPPPPPAIVKNSTNAHRRVAAALPAAQEPER